MSAIHIGKSVSASLEARLIQTLLDNGLSWENISAQTGIYPADIHVPTARIDASKHYRLLALLNRHASDIDWFIDSSSFDNQFLFNKDNILQALSQDAFTLTLLCLNAPCLREALRSYIHYRYIIGNVDSLTMSEDEEHVAIAYFNEYPEINFHSVAMINFIFLIAIIEHYAPGRHAYQIKTRIAENRMVAHVYQYWRCSVEWSCNIDSISFSAREIQAPFPQFNPVVHTLLANQVEQEFQAICEASGFSKIVERTIYEHLLKARDEFNSRDVLDRLCKQYKISRSTVFRKLQQEGNSFRELEKHVKLSESMNMLKNTSMTIAEISHSLGFSSQAAFSKFFDHAVNVSPLKYRKSR